MTDNSQFTPPRKKYKQTTIMDTLFEKVLSNTNATQSEEPSNCEENLTIQGKENLKTLTSSRSAESCSELSIERLSTEILISSEITFYAVIQSEHAMRSCWRGKDLKDISNLLSTSNQQFNEIILCDTHEVLFKTLNGVSDQSSCIKYEDKWDANHVKMPCSSLCHCPVYKNGKSFLEERWTLIKQAYCQRIFNALSLETAILSYNSHYSNTWDFQGFHTFFEKVLSCEERANFFDHTLPGIIRLALQLPEKFPRPPILLVAQKPQALSLTQSQIASLLANAFLNTFPRRNTQKKNSEFSNYPDINFIRLFENKSKAPHVYEKLKCLLHYFHRVSENDPKGVLTFSRTVISHSGFPCWANCSQYLTGLHVSSEGTIEKEGIGLLQIDFANRLIGGGVLSWGCVQEEIRFIVCPELIVARLFTEAMENNEAIVITGPEQYCQHSGYSSSFRFKGDYRDPTPQDKYGRRLCQVVAIDATSYPSKEIQFRKDLLTRELNKAFAGFYCDRNDSNPIGVATGNWGCGAYHGDPRLKSLLQLMAATVTNRDLVYFTFGDEQLREDLFKLYSFLKEKSVTVGKLYGLLCQYGDQFIKSPIPTLDLYDYLFATLDSFDNDYVESSGIRGNKSK